MPNPTSAVPYRGLAAVQAVALLAPYLLVASNDPDDVRDAVAVWVPTMMVLGLGLGMLHSWLVARLDRRLDGPSASRSWALLEGFGTTALSATLPIVIHGPLMAVIGLVEGRSHLVERAFVSVPFILLLGLAWGARRWAASLRRGTIRLAHDPGTVGDIVPTAWLWSVWVLVTGGSAATGAAFLASEAPTTIGILVLAGWVASAGLGALFLASRVAERTADRVERPSALGREAAGATVIGMLLPVFVVGLLPTWTDAPDTRWLMILAMLMLVPAAVWVQASARAQRWARWA